MKVVVDAVFPPIPVRSFDYAACDDETYCGCGECHCPIGHGATEQEAINDLLSQIESS